MYHHQFSASTLESLLNWENNNVLFFFTSKQLQKHSAEEPVKFHSNNNSLLNDSFTRGP